ncbi:MAG: flagellar M-ring protein FliF [Bryobacterales bacterium]|nr:flagellar M-ring protein FliF [Bryobacterales bacterium]
MDQLNRLFGGLSWAQRIWLLIAAVAVGGGLTMFSRWSQERDFKPLYTNLAAEDAGALVGKLKESGIEYRLGENGSVILVLSERVAEARLAMASAGLPKSGRIGFELFDKANFGASDFAEQVNYHRAIEGELERSVMSITEVEQARVHLTLAKESLYSESRQPAKASVLVKLRPGARLSPQNIAAICQLTASAVPELSVDQVALVDTNGTLLSRPRRSLPGEGADSSEAALEYRKSIEKDLQNKIAATLDPLLGLEHFRAGVSADVDVTSADQSEEIYDPQKSAVLTSQTTQDGPASPLAAGGVPGTASNLPRPTAGAAAAPAGAGNFSRKTESVTYQPSRIVKHTKIPQGAVSKLSLSVLVDHTLRWEGSKRVVEPPSPEKLKVIHDLVAAAVGFSMDRGDQLVVEAFPFEATLAAEPPVITPVSSPASGPPNQLPAWMPQWLQKLMGAKNFLLIAGIGAAAMLVLLGVLVWVLMRSRKRKKITAEMATAAIAGDNVRELAAPEDLQKKLQAQMAEQAAQHARREAEELMKLKIPEVSTKKTEVLTKHIAAEAKTNPALMAQVVRSWLNG